VRRTLARATTIQTRRNVGLAGIPEIVFSKCKGRYSNTAYLAVSQMFGAGEPARIDYVCMWLAFRAGLR